MRFTFLVLCAILVLSSCENKEEDTRKYPPADLVFYETYTTDEIQASWMNVIEVVNRPDTSQVIHANAFSGIDLRTLIQPAGDVCLGYVAPENQHRVQELLSMDIVRECLPKEAEILWTWNAEDVGGGQKMYSLYVVHKNGIKPRLTGKDLVDVEVEEDPNTLHINILLTMSEKGTDKWAKMTRDNIKRTIAMVVNGQVLSAPLVIEPITGGKTQISGSFSLDEAKEIAGGIKAGMR
ncbi:MAG: hypothetical protein RI922_2322 [Bacteroidota bacterium]|jgi:hypothetical protein